MSPQDRYQSDPIFARLVDLMRRGIRDAQFTPSEVREAAVVAAYLEETRNPGPRIFALREVEDWITTGRAAIRR